MSEQAHAARPAVREPADARAAADSSAGPAPRGALRAPSAEDRRADFRASVARRNETGLPDPLKQGIEALSGFSLDDVRVHYRSSKPATLQAHAYTQGTDIHVAPGGETHLPHEAWHVVQQKQGRVRATRQLKGARISDDAALEREADIMGSKALGCGERAAPELVPAAGNAPASAILQLTPVVTIDEGAAAAAAMDLGSNEMAAAAAQGAWQIRRIEITGRPDDTFQNSMGAHSTAFTVHVQSIKLNLEGQTYEEAWRRLKNLFSRSMILPGFAAAFDSRSAHAARFAIAFAEMRAMLAVPIAANASRKTQLQNAVAHYLEYRELIAFSTFDVRGRGGSTAGNSEGGPSGRLGEHERGVRRQERATLVSDIVNLLDSSALARIAVEAIPSDLEDMAPGMSGMDEVMDRIRVVLKQHLQSMQTAFPTAVRDSGIATGDDLLKSIPGLREKLLTAALKEFTQMAVSIERQRNHLHAAKAYFHDINQRMSDRNRTKTEFTEGQALLAGLIDEAMERSLMLTHVETLTGLSVSAPRVPIDPIDTSNIETPDDFNQPIATD